MHGEIKEIIPSRKVIRYCKKIIPPFGFYILPYAFIKIFSLEKNLQLFLIHIA
jgi:hypothetical protein